MRKIEWLPEELATVKESSAALVKASNMHDGLVNGTVIISLRRNGVAAPLPQGASVTLAPDGSGFYINGLPELKESQ